MSGEQEPSPNIIRTMGGQNLKPEDLPPEDLVPKPGVDPRLRWNPPAHEHLPTESKMFSASGELITVAHIITLTVDANSTRVQPQQRREIVKAPELWDESLPAHHILTNALRLAQNCSKSEEGTTVQLRRELYMNPQSLLQKSGLSKELAKDSVAQLMDLGLLSRYTYPRKQKPNKWCVKMDCRGVDAEGNLLTAQDLGENLRMPDSPEINLTKKAEASQPNEDEANIDKRFYIGERPRFATQDDRHEVYAKTHEVLKHITRDLTPDEDGWVRYIQNDTTIIDELTELTGVSKHGARSIIKDMERLGIVQPPERIANYKKRPRFAYHINISDREFTTEDVEVTRKLRQEALREKVARAAGRLSASAAPVEVVPEPSERQEVEVIADPELSEDVESPLTDVTPQAEKQLSASEVVDMLVEEIGILEEANRELQTKNDTLRERLKAAERRIAELQKPERIDISKLPERVRRRALGDS